MKITSEMLRGMIILVTGSNKYVELNKSLQPGLKAIQFVYDKSNFKYEYEGEKVLSASGDLEFKNYSKTSRNFYVKYIPDDEFSDQFSTKELIGYKSTLKFYVFCVAFSTSYRC